MTLYIYCLLADGLVHPCNPSTCEAETGLWVECQPGLHLTSSENPGDVCLWRDRNGDGERQADRRKVVFQKKVRSFLCEMEHVSAFLDQIRMSGHNTAKTLAALSSVQQIFLSLELSIVSK